MNVNTAWNEFGIRNGCDSILELKAILAAYNSNVTLSAIGCLILNDICFFDSPVAPATVGLIFPRQVVKLKYYNTPDPFLSHEAISYTGPFVLVNATDKTKNIHLMSERVGQPPQNGLLLRIDLHKMYDSGLLTIDQNYTVHISKKVTSPDYTKFNGNTISLPKDKKQASIIKCYHGKNERI